MINIAIYFLAAECNVHFFQCHFWTQMRVTARIYIVSISNAFDCTIVQEAETIMHQCSGCDRLKASNYLAYSCSR